MLDKEYAVNMLTALVDAAEEMNGHGIKANCLAVNDAVLDTIRGLITYLQNSEKVVRCKDCMYGIDWDGRLGCEWHGFYQTEPNWFCADGERKETEDAVH